MEKGREYYVYVYIDPRNFEEFYYGKGKGSRKEAHLFDSSDSEKVRRINEIKNDNLLPIIKVVAKDLTEEEAFLVEQVFIWKLGKNLTNQVAGNFSNKFRPHNTFHQNLTGFDYNNSIYYVNIGEGPHRTWADCRKYGFIAAGQDNVYSDPFKTIEIGDIIVPYFKGKGYVGVGKVLEKTVGIEDFKFNGQSLRAFELKAERPFENSENEKSEYLIKIDWIVAVEENEGKWAKNSGLFATPAIKASLQNQQLTLSYLEIEFGISFNDLLLN